MTIIERVKAILESDVNLCAEGPATIEKLVYVAYYIGRESATRQVSNRYNQHIKEQKERAKNCRYHKMALDVVGPEDYLYTADYAGDITSMFGPDPADK